MFLRSIPVLHASSSAAAKHFYGDLLGFECRFAYRLDESRDDPCYMGFCRDEAWVHVSSFSGDGVAGNPVNMVVADVDALHEELVARGVDVPLAPMDQTWGAREMHVIDPDGNSIRFVQQGG